MTREQIKQKFIDLVKDNGENFMSVCGECYTLETFNICSNYGVELAQSTIDKIEYDEHNDKVFFFYNENTNDFDEIEHFKVADLKDFYECIEFNLGMAEIFKECEDGKMTAEEFATIYDSGLLYRWNDDRANGYVAFALTCSRRDANALVDDLNEICEKNGEEGNWFLGAVGEEYVCVN